MMYSIKTLSQLPLVIKGFRKEKRLTQAVMAEKLGITQQSYAYFEANPATATLERLFMVLRILDVEISLNQIAPSTGISATPAVKAMGQKISKPPRAAAIKKEKTSAVAKVSRIVAPAGKKESW
jgi:HTH-type transcriptional regulator / antitoxin HipB